MTSLWSGYNLPSKYPPNIKHPLCLTAIKKCLTAIKKFQRDLRVSKQTHLGQLGLDFHPNKTSYLLKLLLLMGSCSLPSGLSTSNGSCCICFKVGPPSAWISACAKGHRAQGSQKYEWISCSKCSSLSFCCHLFWKTMHFNIPSGYLT